VRIHFDVLGWLFILAGAFGVLAGASLLILASGTSAALTSLAVGPGNPTVWFFVLAGGSFIAGGVLMAATGRGVVGRRPAARSTALALAILNLPIVPFGTALGIYAFWTLLNEDARQAFQGRSKKLRRE
jgi:hypothetical protein